MSNFISGVAAVAVIALAAVPVVAVGAANAATPGVRIALSDIDFSRADDLAVFNTRVGAVQRHFCAGPKRSIADRSACREAVREEIVSQLSRQQRLALGAAAATHG